MEIHKFYMGLFDTLIRKRVFDMKDDVQSIIKRRGITELLHFTHPDNIKGIEKYGLLPNRELSGHKRNDYRRIDNWAGVCLSVTHPNEFLLKAYINKGLLPNPPKCIIIDPEVILHEISLFFDCNAATNKFRSDPLYSYEYLKSAEALESMFAEEVIEASRKSFRKSYEPNWTTSWQAEIIVLRVPTKYFKEIKSFDVIQ